MADIQVGLAIRNIRINKGLTQRQVADSMGCHRTYVIKIEMDQHIPRLEQFVRFADALQEDPGEMLSYARRLQREAEV
jgi:transcriptional regulator with XRE-family HTH domain